MNGSSVTSPRRWWHRTGRVITASSYVILGALLALPRLVGLDRSYWHDEIVTVDDFVRVGPREILAGDYVPNNHELFSLVAWAASSLVGESEIALRLLSVLPFLTGVALVVIWLHARVSPLSGVLFLFLATVSPLLLDITRQARGYGLAFLAMSALIVAALEVLRIASTWIIVAFCAAGLVGTWTLPNFGIAFLAIGGVLLTDPRLRSRVAVGLAVSVSLTVAWYAPHFDDLLNASRQQYGMRIELPWVVTAPIDQILLPALLWIDGVLLFSGFTWLPIVAAFLILILPSSLLRERRAALALCAGPIATVLALWLTDTREVPRFLSFLTVPLFILLATGTAETLVRLSSPRPPILRSVLALATLGLLCVGFTLTAPDLMRLPREAHKDVVAVIERKAPNVPVFADTARPRDLDFYLGRRVVRRPFAAKQACASERVVILVVQPWRIRPTAIPCLAREGVREWRFRQYTRGGTIEVWLLPPA